MLRIPRSALRSLDFELQPGQEAWRITYVAAAAKIAEVLEGSDQTSHDHVLLAPMESNVIPLPHQVHTLSRAIFGDRVRYLLADEVGLGKTIEAGLIMSELKLRGLVRRTLVVSPKGIATQWLAEMQTHFNEQFQLVLGVRECQDFLRAFPACGAWSKSVFPYWGPQTIFSGSLH